MKIGIDIDEVVVEFVRGYLKLYEYETGKNVKFEEVRTYHFWEWLPLSKQETIDLAERYFNSRYFKEIELIVDSIESIHSLKDKHEIFFITSRPASWRKATEDFLNKHFAGSNFTLIFSSDFHKDQGKTKAEICKDLGIKLLIEDNANYALDAANLGINVILFDKPWNEKHETPGKVKRLTTWKEAMLYINSLKDNLI